MEFEGSIDAGLARRFTCIASAVNADANLCRRGQYLTANMLVGIGTVAVYVAIGAGHITGMELKPGLMRPWDFAIRGTPQAWSGLWSPVPAPGWHDIFALSKRGELVMEGNLQPFVANLQYLKDVLAMPRHTGNH